MKTVVDEDNDAPSVALLLPISASLVKRNIVHMYIFYTHTCTAERRDVKPIAS